MRIILSNVIKIEEPTKEIKDFCIKSLTFKNPEFDKKKRMGFYAYGTPKEIKLYNYYEGNLYLPYGFFSKLWKQHPISSDYIDYTSSVPRDIKSHMTLRDYQVPCLKAIKEKYCGIFHVVVGLGKTNMALACSSELKQHTLWITHTSDLVKQSKERAEQTLDCTTSTITEGKCDVSGDIVFATVQTLIKFIEKEEISQTEFGMVVVDETHRVSCNVSSIQMFRSCVEYFSARYRLGLTGSLHRADGLIDCVMAIMGEPIYSIYQKNDMYVCEYNGEIINRFSSENYSVKPNVKVIETDYNLEGKEVFAKNGGTIQFASLISDIAKNEERNKVIIDKLNEIEGSTIVLSDRVEQLKYLCSRVDNGVQIDGSTPKKLRAKALDDVRSGRIKYLFASYNLCKEGLDAPILSNLVMATPVKDFSIVVQSIGRIMRPFGNKRKATVYDFVDKVGMLRNFYAKRRSIYRKNKWDIENIYLGG